MDDVQPYPKEKQLARGERRYRRKVASPKQWQAIIAAKSGPCRICFDRNPALLELHHVAADCIPDPAPPHEFVRGSGGRCKVCEKPDLNAIHIVPVSAAVSPADTLRLYIRLRSKCNAGMEREQIEALAAVDEWAAVGERDKAEIERLTEVGKAALIVADLNGERRSTYGRVVTGQEWTTALCNLEMAAIAARAVRADEEDASNG